MRSPVEVVLEDYLRLSNVTSEKAGTGQRRRTTFGSIRPLIWFGFCLDGCEEMVVCVWNALGGNVISRSGTKNVGWL